MSWQETQGFETIKQLLQQQEPYNFILGVRDTKSTEAAYNDLKSDNLKHTIRILPLDLSNLHNVQLFAQQALSQLGSKKLDYLFLNAGMLDDASGPGPNGSEWCEGFIVNHLGELFPITHQASIYYHRQMLSQLQRSTIWSICSVIPWSIRNLALSSFPRAR